MTIEMFLQSNVWPGYHICPQEIFVNLKSALEKYHEGIEATTKEYCSRIEEKTAELKKRMFRVPPSSA